MGGAVSLKASEYLIFQAVKSEVNHVYITTDKVLDLFKLSTGEQPIGQSELDPVLVDKLENILGLTVNQFDISHLTARHAKYRQSFTEILD